MVKRERGYYIILRNALIKENVETKFGYLRDYIILNGDARKFIDLIGIEGYKPPDKSRRRAYVVKKCSKKSKSIFWSTYYGCKADFEFDCKNHDGIDILLRIMKWYDGNYVLIYDTNDAQWGI